MIPKTIRTIINKKLKTIGILILSGLSVFALGSIYSIWKGHGPPPIISIVGFGVAFIAIFYANFGIKCPQCKSIWGHIAMFKGIELSNPFSVSKKIKYCPFCGVDIDTDIYNKRAV